MIGTRSYKDWTGADYPKSSTRKKPFSPWKPGEGGSAFRQKPYPPRRRDMVPHAYSMTAIRNTQGAVNAYKHWLSGSKPTCFDSYSQGQLPFITNDFWYAIGTNPWTSYDDTKLIDKLAEEIKGSDFNPAVFLAEMPQCIQMIGNSATSLAKAIRAFRKGNFRGAAQALQDYNGFPVAASNRWLELQYGWLPLLNDAEGAARFLARSLSQPVFRVSARREVPYTNDPNGLLAGNFSDFIGSWRCYYNTSHGKNSRQLIAYLKTVDNLQLSGLLSPEIVVWELVPFSFVADWFIPIGSYLEQLSLDRALSGTFIRTARVRYSGSGPYKIVKSGPQQIEHYPGTGSGDSIVAMRLAREVYSSLPIQTPAMRGLDGLNVRRALNAIALLGQSMR